MLFPTWIANPAIERALFSTRSSRMIQMNGVSRACMQCHVWHLAPTDHAIIESRWQSSALGWPSTPSFGRWPRRVEPHPDDGVGERDQVAHVLRTPGGSACSARLCDHPVPVRPVYVLDTPEPSIAHPFGCTIHLLGPVQRLRPVVCPASAAPRCLGGRAARVPSDAALCWLGDSATARLRALAPTGPPLSTDSLYVRRRRADRRVERTRIPARRVYDRRRGHTRPVSTQSLVVLDAVRTICHGKRSIGPHHAVLDDCVQPIS